MEFELLRRMGMQIFFVDELNAEVRYVNDCNVGLVRAGMSPDLRQWAADWLLMAVCLEPTTTT